MLRLLLCFLILPCIFPKTPLLSAKSSKARNNNAFLPWNLNSFPHIVPDDGTNSGILHTNVEGAFNQSADKKKQIKNIELEEHNTEKGQEKKTSLRSSINSKKDENDARRKFGKQTQTGLITSSSRTLKNGVDSAEEALKRNLPKISENRTMDKAEDFERMNKEKVDEAVSGKEDLLSVVEADEIKDDPGLANKEGSDKGNSIEKKENRSKDAIVKKKENNLLIENKTQKSGVLSEIKEVTSTPDSKQIKQVLKNTEPGIQVNSDKGKMALKTKDQQKGKDTSENKEDASEIDASVANDGNNRALNLFNKFVSATVVITIVLVFYISLRISNNYQKTLKKREYTDEERQALNITV